MKPQFSPGRKIATGEFHGQLEFLLASSLLLSRLRRKGIFRQIRNIMVACQSERARAVLGNFAFLWKFLYLEIWEKNLKKPLLGCPFCGEHDE